jgi:hypothetical protein
MSYPPPSADSKQDARAYPQPGAQAYGQPQPQPQTAAQAWPLHGETFQDPGTGYQDQGQAYQDQGQAYQDQGQAYQDPGAGYQAPQGQPDPRWQARQGTRAPAARRTNGDAAGFFAALFDFSFTSYVTPKIIKLMYALCTLWVVIWAIIFARLGFKYGGASGGIFTLIIVDPVFLLLTLGAYRIVLEFFIVIHRMNDELKAIREHGQERG